MAFQAVVFDLFDTLVDLYMEKLPRVEQGGRVLPSSAPALASAKGWRDLLIPGILCGSLGYGIGSFIGVRVTTWLM